MHPQLTDREAEIIKLVATGKSNKQIACELSVAVKTVKFHVSNMLSKLGLYNRVELMGWALHHGAVSLEELQQNFQH